MAAIKESFDSLPPVLTPDEMAAADEITISTMGISGFTLMETAGNSVADCVLEVVHSLGMPKSVPATISILCGVGNNGGDGFVAAKILCEHKHHVQVFVIGRSEKMSRDATAHFERMENAFAIVSDQAPMEEGASSCSIHHGEDISVDAKRLAGSDVIIDALIGTGLRSDVRGSIRTAIDAINEVDACVVSVDIPSGLSGLTGDVLGISVKADRTVTLAALKRGLLIGDGPSVAGLISVSDIGISPETISRVQSDDVSVRQMTAGFAAYRRPERTVKSTKYTTGPTLVVSGSEAYTGAPVLAATAAARVGSGYVQCLCPPEIEMLLKQKLTEITVMSWEHTDLNRRLSGARSVLIGPGIGRSKPVADRVLGMMATVSRSTHNRLVIDADGLAAISGKREQIAGWSDGNWILTPHTGELRFLRDKSAPGQSVIDSAVQLARDWNCVVLLKGFPSVSAAPDGRVIINNSVVAAAATAGTGDVLSGIIAGLVAQDVSPFDAAACGVHLASSLSEAYCMNHRGSSMMATDLLIALTKKAI